MRASFPGTMSATDRSAAVHADTFLTEQEYLANEPASGSNGKFIAIGLLAERASEAFA